MWKLELELELELFFSVRGTYRVYRGRRPCCASVRAVAENRVFCNISVDLSRETCIARGDVKTYQI